MLARRTGWVVNVASMAGRIWCRFRRSYTASKAGLLAFANSLRRQLDGTGIEVVSVLPGYTHTPMVPSQVEQLAKQHGMTVDTPDYVAEHTIDELLEGQARNSVWRVDGTGGDLGRALLSLADEPSLAGCHDAGDYRRL